MKKHEKEIEQVLLNNEKDVYNRLEGTYNQALKDVQGKYKELQESIDKLIEKESRYTNDPEQLEIIKSQIQSKIYQQNYQKALQEQLNNALDTLNSSTVNSIEDYLNTMYQDGFISQLYSLQKYGIPVLAPINHELLVKAVSYNTDNIPLSKRIYSNVEKAKRQIRDEISRGIATGMSQQDIARNISDKMGVSYRKAKQIAQNEGHRVVNDAKIDSMHASKDRGADIVKVWDCTFDKKTRPIHAQLDQQHAEIDDYFEYSGGKVFAPKRFGKASLDINCRCALMSVPRWDIEDEVEKRDNITSELIKAKNYADWKEKYYNVVEKYDDVNHVLDKAIKTSEEHYNTLLTNLDIISKKTGNLEYNPVLDYDVAPIDENDIISSLSGGDLTQGSCASVALAYIGQKQGWNVLDFRGGESQYFFSSGMNLFELSLADGLKVLRAEGKSSMTVANKLIKLCEESKEYYLSVGRHAAIVRKKDGILQYLELQSESKSGWTNFNGNPKYTLKTRFGCSSRSSFSAKFDFMIDIDDSDFSTDEFKSLLGYLNTAGDAQKKGQYGTIK
jgi:SPP1 gp7 family putative phage head morphogenesis protein